jgi:thioredoxin 1
MQLMFTFVAPVTFITAVTFLGKNFDPYFSLVSPLILMAHAATDATFDEEVMKSPLPVLVDFWAPWCGPCKAMNPILEELAAEFDGKVKIVKVNVDENIDTAGKFNVLSIPTFLMVKDGKAVGSVVGARSKADMKKEIEKIA